MIEPVQQQSTSKYGRKVSQFVFKVLKNESLDTVTNDTIRTNPFKRPAIIKEKNFHHPSTIENNEEVPSIVLYRSDSNIGDSVLEQHLDISPDAIVKKIKIIPSCEVVVPKQKTPLRHYRRSRGKPPIPKKCEPNSCNNITTETSLAATHYSSCPPIKKEPQTQPQSLLFPANELEEKLVADRVEMEEKRLKIENKRLSRHLGELKVKVQKVSEIQSYQRERLTLSKLKQNQEMLYYYVGFKDLDLIDSMVGKLSEYFSLREKINEELMIEDQLVMTLMKLRRNYSMHDLAFRFRVSLSEADCIVYNTILALHHIYYDSDLKERPFPPLNSMWSHLPEQFNSFPNCRVVLECVRIGCEDPDYSSETDILTSTKFDPKVYVKGFMGISPTKNVLFASGVYEDSTNNSDIFKESGILTKLESGDLIMADKSFEITGCIPSTIELNVAASTKVNLTDKQIKNLNSKARAYIGRTTMQHIRRFTILNHVPIFLNSIVLQVFQLCSALVNLQPTITSFNEALD